MANKERQLFSIFACDRVKKELVRSALTAAVIAGSLVLVNKDHSNQMDNIYYNASITSEEIKPAKNRIPVFEHKIREAVRSGDMDRAKAIMGDPQFARDLQVTENSSQIDKLREDIERKSMLKGVLVSLGAVPAVPISEYLLGKLRKKKR